MADIPKTMRSLVAPKPCKPDEYEVRNLPVPTISDPDEVLLRVHAAGINTGDPQVASGQLSIFHKPEYVFIPTPQRPPRSTSELTNVSYQISLANRR